MSAAQTEFGSGGHDVQDRHAARRFARGLVLPVALVLIWFGVTHLNLVNARLVVRPERAFWTAIEQYRSGAVVRPLLASLGRNLTGLAIGTLLGLIAGGTLGVSRLAERVIGPSLHAAKQVAIFAWIPLISVWFGVGEPAKIVFIALSAFYPVVLNTHQGVRSVSRDYIEVAAVYEFSRWHVLRKVIVPGAIPSIFAGFRLALIYAWLATLGSEYLLAAAPGIGNLMIEGREALAMDKVMVGIVLAGLLGAGLGALAGRLERHVLRWRVPNA
jgi:sulfonate transport system permease protein